MKKHLLTIIASALIVLSLSSCELLALLQLGNELEKVFSGQVTIGYGDDGLDYYGDKYEKDEGYAYGATVTLKVKATADQVGTMTYQWYTTDKSYASDTDEKLSDETSDTLTLTKNEESEAYYYCKATNTRGKDSYTNTTHPVFIKFTMFRIYDYATINESTTWNSEYTYLIKGWLNIDKKLNIPAGTVVKFLNGAEINTEDQGLISAAGTKENPVIFTSYRDDTAGRKYIDSTSNPDAGDWDFIKIKGATGSAFEYCDFRYGKNALILKSKSTVKNCTFRDNKSGEEEGALQNDTLDSTIEDCIFYRNDCPLSCEPGYIVSTTNIFHKDDDLNTCQYIKLYAYRDFDGGNWSVSELPYMLEGWTNVNEGKKLTIGSGVICKFLNGASLTIKEGATAEFADDCLFTSYRDDYNGGDSDGDNGEPDTGDWKGIKDDNLGKWLTGDNILHAELHN